MFAIIFSILEFIGISIGVFFLVKFLIRDYKFSREVTVKNYLNLQRIADALNRKDEK